MSSNSTQRSEAMKYVNEILERFYEIDREEELQTFEMKDNDIVVTTFPKAGTVLMQQMVYQIAVQSGGFPPKDTTGEEFEDISTIVPWIEMRNILRTSPSKTNPRTFKTHLPVSSFPKNSVKHVVIIRNPLQFPASFLNFLFDAIYPDVSKTLSSEVLEECVYIISRNCLLDFGKDRRFPDLIPNWHNHVKNCICPTRENVLVLFYEDVTADFQSSVKRVARFMGCKVPDVAIPIIVSRCTQEYMSNSTKFRGINSKKLLSFPRNTINAYPKGYVGFKKYDLRKDILDEVSEYMDKTFGVKSYSDLRMKVSNEQKRYHGY